MKIPEWLKSTLVCVGEAVGLIHEDTINRNSTFFGPVGALTVHYVMNKLIMPALYEICLLNFCYFLHPFYRYR
jgi:hypothetical protein